MLKHQKIKAVFFLCIFSMLLLHQVIPHQHQEELQHVGEAHSHHHDHKPKKSEKENSKIDFFDWFGEMHVHTYVTTEVLVMKHSTVNKITVKKESVKSIKSIPNKNVKLAFIEEVIPNKKWDQPPDKFHKIYFPNCSFRGPPSLS